MKSIEWILIENRAKPSPLALKQIEDLARGLGERGKEPLIGIFPGEES